jgi:hypothetical protein
MRTILQNSVSFLGLAILGLANLSTSNVFAGGFTSGKGAYDFTIEYMGKQTNKLEGKKYNSGVEINNDFGITENQSLGFDVFIDRDAGSDQTQSFQTRHRMNFKYNDSISFGLQNSLGFFDNNNGTYKMRWALRGMVRHDTKSGFYKHSRLEIEHRRFFSEGSLNAMRFDVRTKFRLTESIDLLIRVNTYLKFASKDYVEAIGNDLASESGITQYSLKGLKVADSEIYFGPEFRLSNDSMVYAYAYSQLKSAPANKSKAKGLLVGYSMSLSL